jgi:hypothetical protein
MELAILVYLISLIGSVTTLAGVLLFVAGLTAVIFSIVFMTQVFDSTSEYSWNLNRDGTLKQSVLAARALQKRLLKVSSIVAIIMAFIVVLVPSSKTAWTMVGAYAAQKIAQDPRTVDVGSKVMTIIEQQLDRVIEEGSKKAMEQVKEKASK